ncbi:ribonuclease D [Candidatus Rariloculus sp.]|uniref:ribonuclease D n=1 Tax=Candidatus Rariloculus sp. TaxID=3101265 RepID=UPI003D09DB08
MHENLLVGDEKTLCDLAESIASAPLVAVDTEFVRESTYFPKLCLIQVATDKVRACVDCLTDIGLEPLLEELFASGRKWVLHSARQDLEVLWNHSGRMPSSVIDTQIAAALVGFPPQLGLQELVAETLGVELDKSHTRTDWTRRPLPEAALRYALDDVHHLLPAWGHLRERLVELDRLEWFAEDSRRALEVLPIADATTIFQRMRGAAALSVDECAAALALVRWREDKARELDRPRRWIVSDEVMIRVTKAMPQSLEQLRAVPELPKRLAARSGRAMLAAVEASRSPGPRAEARRASPSRKPDKGELKMLQAIVKERAEQLGIHPEVLATRRVLSALAAGDAPAILATGWRAAALNRGPDGDFR